MIQFTHNVFCHGITVRKSDKKTCDGRGPVLCKKVDDRVRHCQSKIKI